MLPRKMKRRNIYFVSASVFLFLALSCMEKLDFDQYDDLRLRPTYEASILYVEASENAIDAADPITFFTWDLNFDAFSENVFADRVRSGVVTYVVENTTSKEFEIEVEFLDETGNVLYIEEFMVPPAPIAPMQTEILFGPGGESLDIIRNTSGFRVSATVGPNSSTSDLPDAKITMKSSGAFTVAIK